MTEEHYVVTVPENVHPGEYFNVILGPSSRLFTVQCPEGMGPGSRIDLRINEFTEQVFQHLNNCVYIGL